MPTAMVHFERCIQDSQTYGSDDEHMVSRVFFSINVGGTDYPGLSVDVKQSVGEDFEAATLEVSRPHGFPLFYAPFREAVEAYYRSLVGKSGRGIRIAGGKNVWMRSTNLSAQRDVAVDYEDASAAW